MVWSVCRALFNADCTVPKWSGWLLFTAPTTGAPAERSVIGFMPPILHPITERSTIQECLRQSVEVSQRLQQPYTFVTMDLAAAKIAYELQWNSAERFSSVIIHLGGFHTMCSYMWYIGKVMTGSGFEDIVLETGICASGSIRKVISGKHYNRALHVHLQHELLLKAFLHGQPLSVKFPAVCDGFTDLCGNLSHESLLELLNNDDFQQFNAVYNSYRNDVRCGEYGKTAQFWMMYLDSMWNLLNFQTTWTYIWHQCFSFYHLSLPSITTTMPGICQCTTHS